MKILLDECIDRRFARELPIYEVRTVPQMGWAGIKNGDLMRLAEASFDVFITVDRNLSYQQNLPKFNIILFVLKAPSNRYEDLKPLSQMLNEKLGELDTGKSSLILIG